MLKVPIVNIAPAVTGRPIFNSALAMFQSKPGSGRIGLTIHVTVSAATSLAAYAHAMPSGPFVVSSTATVTVVRTRRRATVTIVRRR